MKTGLDYFLDEVRKLTRAKPPFNAAFTTQAVYTLNQAVTIIEGLKEIHNKQKAEIEFLKSENKKSKRTPTDPVRNAAMIADHQAGMTTRAIGKKYGITAGRVCQILLKLGVRDAGPSRVKRIPVEGDPERQGSFEIGKEARDPSDADRIGQDSDGGIGDRLGAWQG